MVDDLALSPRPAAKPSGGAPSKTDVLKQRALVIGIALAVMWGLEILDAILGQPMNGWGIRPRELTGLLGIPLAPVLHGDFGHLAANTVPFAVLAFLTMLRGMKSFAVVTVIVALAGGIGVWLVGGSNTSHIGASGLIFGYFAYNIAAAIFERSFKNIALAALVGLLYGGMIFGVLPGKSGISWEGHLFGAAAGVGWAWYQGRKLAVAKAKK